MWFKNEKTVGNGSALKEKEYDIIMGEGRLLRSDSNASVSLSSNELAMQTFIKAMFVANDSQLGIDKQMDAIGNAYEVSFKNGEIAANLGMHSLSSRYYVRAARIAGSFALGKEMVDDALSKARSERTLTLKRT